VIHAFGWARRDVRLCEGFSDAGQRYARPRTGPVSEKQQCTKSRLLRWCNGLGVPRAEPYGD